MTFEILNMDCRDALALFIEPGSVQTCITSPPYFGLRDYGHAAQLGLEQTPEKYVAAMVEVFRGVRRALRDDGTLWLNLGDSYAGSRAGPQGQSGQSGQSGQMADRSVAAARVRTASPEMIVRGKRDAKRWGGGNVACGDGLKNKDLIGIPWRVALALQADGWYLRQDIIWHKPNPMPESVTDRCTKSHEYIFLLSKSERYYFDHEAVMEPVAASTVERLGQRTLRSQAGSARVPGKTNGNMKAVGRTDKRNLRSVWSVPTRPYRGAHFATYPPELIEPCVLAGSRPSDLVLDPFLGSGTTAAVALQHGRRAVGCELNPEYIDLARQRIANVEPAADYFA